MPEVQITTLTEILMRQAVKLDGISAEGDAVPLKSSQVLDRLPTQQERTTSCPVRETARFENILKK